MYHNSPYFSSFHSPTILYGVCVCLVGFTWWTHKNLFTYNYIVIPTNMKTPLSVNYHVMNKITQLTTRRHGKNHPEFRNKSHQFPSPIINTGQFRPRKVLPHCIVIGVSKCGTTAFSSMLNDLIPNIQMKKEESYFFMKDHLYAKGIEYYKESLPTMTKTEDIIMERTPSYYRMSSVPKRIHSILPKVKLILLVCDPLKRTVSDFLQQRIKATLSKRFTTLEKYLTRPGGYRERREIIKRSIYANYMKQWLSLFPRNQILILNGDILRDNPYSIVMQTEKFLGLRNIVSKADFILKNSSTMYCWKLRYENNSTRCLHNTKLKGRPHPNISQQLMSWLTHYFTPHNQRFFNQIGEKFKWTMDEAR